MTTARAAREQHHLIGGDWRPSANGSTFERMNPFAGDPDTGMAAARKIDSGICHVNGSTVHDEPQMPFGGVKASGRGRFGGQFALHEFTDLRWLTVQEGGRHYPI